MRSAQDALRKIKMGRNESGPFFNFAFLIFNFLLVLRQTRVDLTRPGQDAAFDVLDVLHPDVIA